MKMNSTSDYISMKKSLLLTLLIPLLLTSCGHSGVSLDAMRAHIGKIEVTDTPEHEQHPYYKVVGSIDIAGMYSEISEDDGTFDKMPNGETYVANARYNEGFYNPAAERMTMLGISDYEEEDIVIYGMSSRSYWARMPLRVHKDNFYVEKDLIDEKTGEVIGKELNRSCAYSNFLYFITAWIDANGSVNASSNRMYMEILPDGGFAFGGDSVRTQICIDNYPYYMNYEKHPELGDEWNPKRPLPCYSYNGGGFMDGRFNIRFEYDKYGWLKSESVYTTDYSFSSSTQGQLAFKAIYSYKFS